MTLPENDVYPLLFKDKDEVERHLKSGKGNVR